MIDLPNSKDKLFISKSGGDKDYASINRTKGLNNEHSLFLTIEGYRDAATELLNNLIADKEPDWLKINSKIYPILFLFRHYLEIIIKDTIRHYKIIKREAFSNEVGFEPTHSLNTLWSLLRPNLEDKYQYYDESLKKEYKETNNAIEQLIIEIEKIDKGSFAFRYPFERPKKGDNNISYSLPAMTIDLKI